MVGATPESFAAVKPVIACFAAKIVHVGPVGAGHTMKLLNNFVSIGYATIYSEALALGARVGISPAQFHAVIGGGRMHCPFYETFMKYVVERDRDAHKFTLANAHKDMRYLANLATGANVAVFAHSVIRNYLASAESMGKGGDYLPMLSDHVAALNGVKLS
jgi:3-hydroxyisobutyrate dehydrogenase-like beta-hydroxyacid dehydrogenase